ncbi:unnamed protein product, partial [Mycena citricolor]
HARDRWRRVKFIVSTTKWCRQTTLECILVLFSPAGMVDIDRYRFGESGLLRLEMGIDSDPRIYGRREVRKIR